MPRLLKPALFHGAKIGAPLGHCSNLCLEGGAGWLGHLHQKNASCILNLALHPVDARNRG